MKTRPTHSLLKHFALIEVGNDECPMIGVITNIVDSPSFIPEFRERFMKAVGSHFDYYLDEVEFEIPDLFTGSPYEDIELELSDVQEKYTVRIIETWIY